MLNVYISVDTEIWWDAPDLSTFPRDYARWFLGRTSRGEYGVPFQVNLLKDHGLTAIFLTEPLFASAVGLEPLKDMVSLMQEQQQSVQLHLHAEWLSRMSTPPVAPNGRRHIRHFSEQEQVLLLAEALGNLRAAGAEEVYAFRAGNFGANFATLRALFRNGIKVDTSHNTCYLQAACDLPTPSPLLQPQTLEGVLEFPVTFFEDWPGHRRPAHLNACSFSEMKHALLQAWERGWRSFVIVSHSFELLNAGRTLPDPIVIRRFEQLCRFLAENRDKFRTAGFDRETVDAPLGDPTPLRGTLPRTVWRMGEQLVSRLRR